MSGFKLKDIKKAVRISRDLPRVETREFRSNWVKTFSGSSMHHCPSCKDFKESSAYTYDWHCLSFREVPNIDNYLEVISKAAIPDKEEVVVFEENCGQEGIVVEFLELKNFLANNKDKSFDDIYFTSYDLSWTLVLTHEDGWIGPFFVKKQA